MAFGWHANDLEMTLRRIFIAGTDTGVGKTYIATRWLKALAEQGQQVVGLKPIACGTEQTGLHQGKNLDAVSLQESSTIKISYDQTNPICFPEPTAPHIAAELNGVSIDLKDLLARSLETEREICRIAKSEDLTLIYEGAGGWDVPLNRNDSLSDYACQLNSEIVLVIGLRLGCLNHGRLSVSAIQNDLARYREQYPDGKLLGFILNKPNKHVEFETNYIEALHDMIDAPCLETVEYGR